MVAISFILKYTITRWVFVSNQQDQNPSTTLPKGLKCELFVQLIFDMALVNIFILSASLVSQGGVDMNGDTCSTSTFKFQLIYASAVYGVDVIGDLVALYWGRILGFHAKDYGSAKFEGLERVHGYTLILPNIAYFGAASVWMYEAPITEVEHPAIWVTYSFLFAILFIMIIYNLYYDWKYVPKWSCKRCRWSWICNYCYRNKGKEPQYGPVWGGSFTASSSIGLLFLTIAEACAVWVLDSVAFASLFIVLLALDIILFGLQWYCERIEAMEINQATRAAEELAIDIRVQS